MRIFLDKADAKIWLDDVFVADNLTDINANIVSIEYETATQIGSILLSDTSVKYMGASDFAPYQKYINLFYLKNTTPPAFNLGAAIQAKIQQLAEAREAANLTTFTYLAKTYSATQTAQNDLNGIANYVSLNAGLPASFPGFWQAITGELLPLPSVAAFNAFYTAFVNQGNANFIKMAGLIGQAQAATTQAQLDAIIWD